MPLTIEGPTPRPARGSADIALSGAAADAYVERLSRALRAGRLNALFPPERPLRAHVGFLGPAGSGGLYPELRVSKLNGLPSAREVLRVKIDRDLAADFLARARSRRSPAAGSRMQRRIDYYERLAATEVMPANRIRVDLRQQIPEENRALLRVVLDRFDLAGNQFVRYTILLVQRDRFWRRRHVIVDDADLAAPTEAFRRIVARFTAHEAELAFVLLSRLQGIEVEDARRCRIGPLLLPGAKVGAEIEALLDPERGPCAGGPPPWILCFPEDRAGIEVAEHSGGDPFAPLYREAVSEEARELVDAKADELGYRVAKSRKLVCSPPLKEPLAQLCRQVGAPSIVRAA